ncbi:MAG TPA: hypothetical protein VK395_18140 [Gemmataceae bacterium]|nr:hypothetical protein [Gemmataceae bacterium]
MVASQGTNGNGQAQAAEIAAACARFVTEPDQLIELRGLHAGKAGTVSGYFTDLKKLGEAAQYYSGKAQGLYITPNPVRGDLLARAKNRVIERAQHTTSDADILGLRWMLTDFDPVRPAGISSTDAEHAAALARARDCRDYLGSFGWPSPIYGDSSNGAHLSYAIDLPNEPWAIELLKKCLQVLSSRFSDKSVAVDLKTCNPARIWKCYGALSCKGDNLPERPHRYAKVLEAPGPLVRVPKDLLEALAAKLVPPPPPQSSERTRQDGTYSRLKVEQWLQDRGRGFKVKLTPTPDGRTVYILTECPFDQAHGGNGEVSIMQNSSGKLSAACMHNSCDGKGWQEFKVAIGAPDGHHYDPPLSGNGRLRENSTSPRAPQVATVFDVGPLQLYPDAPRRSGGTGKITVPVKVMRGQLFLDQIPLSNSATGRRQVVSLLSHHLGKNASEHREKSHQVLGLIIAQGIELLAGSQSIDEGRWLRDIVGPNASKSLKIVCRTDRGVWSESRGCEITRADYLSCTPGWLVDEAEEAVDAPHDANGVVNRHMLLKAIKSELEVSWADLIDKLPLASGADLNQNTAVGRKFREAMVRLLTATQTFEVSRTVEGTNGKSVAARASLISRVRSQFAQQRPGMRASARERWREVQKAFAAWWRPHVGADGELTVVLAIRWELVGQIHVELPGVHDQASLTSLGLKFGVLSEMPRVPTRLSGGRHLAVISQDLTQELFDDPSKWVDGHATGEDGVTELSDSAGAEVANQLDDSVTQ